MTAISKQPIIIYAFPGSQFVHKVLAAVESRKLDVPVYVTFVDLPNVEKRRKQLPSGGTLVPEMKVGTGDNKVIVSGSEDILHWLDKNHGTKFFPTHEASELSKRASDNTLAAMVWYYNFVDREGYELSLQRKFREVLFPRWFPQCLGNAIVDAAVKPKVPEKAKAIVTAIPEVDHAMLEDEPAMRRKLVEELKYFQGLLERTSSQKFLLPNTDEPSAADFSVYAQVARMLAGGTNDSEIYAATPDLRDEPSLRTLWDWYDNMKEDYFVKFKGRQPPNELLSKL